jgi:hypothetical protein
MTATPDGVTRSTRQPDVESAYWLLPLPPEPLRSAVIQLDAIASRRLTGERDGGGCGSARSIASGPGSTAEATAAGSAAKLAVTGGAPRTGDVTAGGENRN